MPLPLGAEPPLPGLSLSTSINGTAEEALERWKVTEIMNGFPAHRDACEWTKMRALFAAQDAYVFTTWSGGVPIDEFIKISQTGFEKGVKIAHRVNGHTVDVAKSGQRALGKLKATITQRFTLATASGEPCQVDIEADCRLCFFMQMHDGEWKTHFFKGFYEKDKAIPVNPAKIPHFDEEKLASFPEGYRFLAYGQSSAYKIKMDLPQSAGQEHDDFYESFISWLEGDSIDSLKVKLGV